MVILKTRCKPFSVQEPYRPERPKSDKIIFLSCEGCVTEEEEWGKRPLSKLTHDILSQYSNEVKD